MTEDELIRAMQADGLVGQKPVNLLGPDGNPLRGGDPLSGPDVTIHKRGRDVTITGKPIPIEKDDTFTVQLPIPPLHRPQVDLLLEALQGEEGDYWRAYPAEREIRIGPCVTIELESMSAVGATRDEAVSKISSLIGQAVAQVYVSLMASDEDNKIAAGRSMEIGGDRA